MPSALIASLTVLVLDRGIRSVVFQRRPPGATKHIGRERFAYPSGHTAATAAITLAAALDLGELLDRRDRALLYAATSLCTAAVGWSRLELDEHWIDDVVGGWAMGVMVALVTHAGVGGWATR